MKIVFAATVGLLVILPFASDCMGQKGGVPFERSLSFSAVARKAGAEGKLIFVDCYTTWCGPCKAMDKEIFSKDSVSAYLGDHFVCTRAQMDSTPKDPAEVVRRYADARKIDSQYKIRAYPTFLFLTPGGRLIGRATGKVNWQKDFIALASNATDYLQRVQEYEAGKRDSAFIRKLAYQAGSAGDSDLVRRLGNDFYRMITARLDKSNIAFMTMVTRHSDDVGFKFFWQHRDSIDHAVNRQGYALRAVGNIVYNEMIKPAVAQGVEWPAIYKDVCAQYPCFGDEVVGVWRLEVDISEKKWSDFGASVLPFMRKYYSHWDQDPDFLNVLAYNVFLHCDGKETLEAAERWVLRSLELDKGYWNMDTYANLLYKLGKREEGIQWEEQALSANTKDRGLLHTLEKMKAGEKTW